MPSSCDLAREKLVALAKKMGLDLRQSYTRVGKFALIKHQRYAHAKQFKRAGNSHFTTHDTLTPSRFATAWRLSPAFTKRTARWRISIG